MKTKDIQVESLVVALLQSMLTLLWEFLANCLNVELTVSTA